MLRTTAKKKKIKRECFVLWKTFFLRGSANQLKTKTTVLPYYINTKQSLRQCKYNWLYKLLLICWKNQHFNNNWLIRWKRKVHLFLIIARIFKFQLKYSFYKRGNSIIIHNYFVKRNIWFNKPRSSHVQRQLRKFCCFIV